MTSRLGRVLAQAKASAARQAAAADDQAQIQDGILAMLTRPMTPGLIISQSTWKPSEVVDALKALTDAGKVREAGNDMLARVDA